MPDGRRRWFAPFLVCGCLVAALCSAAGVHAQPQPATIASIPYWSLDGRTDSVVAHRNLFTEASPWLFGLDAGGSVVWQPAALRHDGRAQLDRLRATGLLLLPTIANVVEGQWHPELVRRLLHDPAARARHVAEIAALVRQSRFDGIDIDYEELRGPDRAVFTAFLTELSNALHANGKLLSVDLFAKASDAGYDERNLAQDYRAIGAVADQVRLMAYEYHWRSSPPGPVAPLPWIREVLQYAVGQIPRGRIVLGIPLYGYDWVGNTGEPVTWLQSYGRSTEYRAPVDWDGFSESPHLSYTDRGGTRHELWFENAYSASAKLDAAREFGVGGVFLWMFGQEDDLLWSKLGAHWHRPSTEVTR